MRTMTYLEQPAPVSLARWVECSWERTGVEGNDRFARIVPDGCMDLLWSERAGLVVVGPNTSAFLAPLRPGTSAVGVRLHPGAAPPLFGVAAPALRDARVRASEVWGAPGARLEEEVAQAATPARRSALLLGWITQQARRARPPDPLVRAAALRLASVPDAKVGGLARELAVSERHLRRRVNEQVGYGPKRLGRVLRLRRAIARVRAGAELAEVAYEAGYADQAHFGNECRALAGAAPSAFRSPA
jgi:AraC-like DNA-binding protein